MTTIQVLFSAVAALAVATTGCSQAPQSSADAGSTTAAPDVARVDAREATFRSPPGVLVPALRDSHYRTSWCTRVRAVAAAALGWTTCAMPDFRSRCAAPTISDR